MSTSIPASTLEKFTTFGDLLRFLRRRAGITQMELAIAVGYSDTQISRLEQNQRPPDIPTIEARFLSALGLEDEPKAVARLLDLAANVRREDAPGLGLCPYKGLNYFDEADADLFVGREELTAKLVERVLSLTSNGSSNQPRFLAVVGASGSGKSSLMRAGLIPALRWNKKSIHWQIHILTPTAHPLESLAASLTPENETVSVITTLMDDLARDPRNLQILAKHKLGATDGSNLLLVIDQFEELFTLCRSEEERALFIGNLLTAASEADGPVVLLIALRADFYAHCANYVQLREALSKHQEYIGAMNEEELRRAIEEPAHRGRWEFESGLVDLLLHDIGHEPGALPLLSHSLLETWHRRRGRVMTLSGYTSSGGVRGAIAETAEAVFADRFTHDQQDVARRIFLRLTELGDETATGDTRRRATFNELILKPEETNTTHTLLKVLADARLIVTSEDTVEVAHEALIREWPRLRSWLEDNREGLRLHRQLTETAQEWEALNHEPELLYRGARLTQAQEWALTHREEMNNLEREFLDASIVWTERETAERERRRQRELEAAHKLAESESQRVEEQRLASQRLRQRAWILSALLVIAGILAIVAFGFSRQRDEVAKLATSRELASASVSNLDVDPERSILLALEALSIAHTREAEEALHQSVFASRVEMILRGHAGLVGVAIYNPDGSRIATAGEDGYVQIWDAASGKTMVTLSGHEGPVYEVIFNPNGNRIATAGEDGTARIWDTASGEMVLRLEGKQGAVIGLAFNPDTTRLATGGVDGSVILWDLESGAQLHRLHAHEVEVVSIAFTPDGQQLVTSSFDNRLIFWDVVSGEKLRTWEGEFGNLVLSTDGKLLMANFGEGGKIMDVETGEELMKTGGHTNVVLTAAVSSDWTRIATAGLDRKVIISETGSGRNLFTLSGHTGEILDVQFSPDGKHLVTASSDGTARIWNAGAAREALSIQTHDSWGRMALSPDGKFVSVGDEQYLKVWDVEDGQEHFSFEMPARATGVAFDPSGSRLAGGTEKGDIVSWDLRSGEKVLEIKASDILIFFLAFSPDGSKLASAGEDHLVKVWDAENGDLLFNLEGHDYPATSVAFSPDGKRLASGGVDNIAIVWDAISGEKLFTLQGHTDAVWGVAFSPDGKRIATASSDSTAGIWDANSGEELLRLSGHTSTIVSVSFSPDGTQLATTGRDGVTKLWDANSGDLLLNLYGNGEGLIGVAFSPDGKRLTTTGQKSIHIYLLQLDDLIPLAKTRVTRSLTEAECLQYLHVDQCPVKPP